MILARSLPLIPLAKRRPILLAQSSALELVRLRGFDGLEGEEAPPEVVDELANDSGRPSEPAPEYWLPESSLCFKDEALLVVSTLSVDDTVEARRRPAVLCVRRRARKLLLRDGVLCGGEPELLESGSITGAEDLNVTSS